MAIQDAVKWLYKKGNPIGKNAFCRGLLHTPTLRLFSQNGAYQDFSWVTMELSLVGAGPVQGPAAQLPAGSAVRAVVYRVINPITGATAFTIGDQTTAARFFAAQTTYTAGTVGKVLVPEASAGNSVDSRIQVAWTGTGTLVSRIRVEVLLQTLANLRQ